jgi:hypothetical protein
MWTTALRGNNFHVNWTSCSRDNGLGPNLMEHRCSSLYFSAAWWVSRSPVDFRNRTFLLDRPTCCCLAINVEQASNYPWSFSHSLKLDRSGSCLFSKKQKQNLLYSRYVRNGHGNGLRSNGELSGTRVSGETRILNRVKLVGPQTLPRCPGSIPILFSS